MVEDVVSVIRSELKWIYELEGVIAVLLFGSRVNGTATNESDYDICVVAPRLQSSSEKAKMLGEIWKNINATKYDIWLFEELALHFQIDIIQNHEVLFCEDIPELYEYFYEFRKRWKTQSHRQALSYEGG